MITEIKIQVFAAYGAQPFAIGAAKRANWDFEDHVLPDEGCKVDLTIFRQAQVGVGYGSLGKGVQFSKIDVQRLRKICQTATALTEQGGMQFYLGEQALRGAGDPGDANQVVELKVWRQLEPRDLNLKIPAVADRLINQETGIQPEQIPGLVHGLCCSMIMSACLLEIIA